MNGETDLMRQCRALRDKGRQFEVGDHCWLDPDTINKDGERPGATVGWIVGRGPEWVVREVYRDGVYASYKISHAPDFFELDQLIPLCREQEAKG